MGWAFACAREGKKRRLGGLGQIACLTRFFEIKTFSIFLPAKQFKQNQNKTKIDQIKFVEFRKINSTTIVTQTNK